MAKYKPEAQDRKRVNLLVGLFRYSYFYSIATATKLSKYAEATGVVRELRRSSQL